MKNKKTLFYLIIMIVAMILPNISFADDYTLFSVPDTDIAKSQIIDYLFGPLDGGTSNPLGQIPLIFNGSILILGGLYLMYTYIVGVAQSASDGTFLGKRWSSMWVPARMIIGSVLAFPSLTGGYCLAQWLVIWLSLQGVGFANKIWSGYTQDPLGGFVTTSVVNNQAPYRFARQAFLNAVCTELFNKSAGLGDYSSEYDANQREAIQNITGTSPLSVKLETTTLSDGSTTLSGYTYDYSSLSLGQVANTLSGASNLFGTMCGNVTFNLAKQNTSSGDTTETKSASLLGISMPWLASTTTETLSSQSTDALDIASVANAFIPIHQQEMEAIVQQTQSLAKSWVKSPTSDFTSINLSLLSLANNYVSKINSTLENQKSNIQTLSSNFSKSLSSDGFIMAGAYYVKIAKMQQSLYAGMNDYPTITAPEVMQHYSVDVGSHGVLNYTSPLMGLYNYFANSRNQSMVQVVKSVWGPYHQALAGTESDSMRLSEFSNNSSYGGASSGMSSVLAKIFNLDVKPSDIFSELVGQSTANPLFLSQDIGQKMVSWAWGILGLGLSVGMLSGNLMGSFLQFTQMLFEIIIIPGAILTTIIPMIPFLLWLGSVLSWIVLLVEGIVATPIWAVTHLSPNGEGMSGEAKPGWSMLLSLTLRPLLMVIGFIFSIILMQPMGILFNPIFAISFGSVALGVDGSFNYLTSIIAGCFLYSYVLAKLVSTIFELAHHIPDKVLNWIGVSSGSLQHLMEFSGRAGENIAQSLQMVDRVRKGGSEVLAGGFKKIVGGDDNPLNGNGNGNTPQGSGPQGGGQNPVNNDQITPSSKLKRNNPSPTTPPRSVPPTLPPESPSNNQTPPSKDDDKEDDDKGDDENKD